VYPLRIHASLCVYHSAHTCIPVYVTVCTTVRRQPPTMGERCTTMRRQPPTMGEREQRCADSLPTMGRERDNDAQTASLPWWEGHNDAQTASLPWCERYTRGYEGHAGYTPPWVCGTGRLYTTLGM